MSQIVLKSILRVGGRVKTKTSATKKWGPTKSIPLILVLALVAGYMALGSGGPLYAHRCDATVSPGVGTPIQDAVDAAALYDTICVKPGTYMEHVLVDVGGLTLRGVGGRQPVVDGDGVGSTIIVTADGVTVKNLKVKGGGDVGVGGNPDSDAGIHVKSDNIITGNTATLNGRAGIWLAGGANGNTIEGNKVVNNGVCGIVLDNGADGNRVRKNDFSENGSSGIRLHSSWNTVSHNTSTGNPDGIRLQWGASNNNISHNEVKDNDKHGIDLRTHATLGDANGNKIHHNDVEDNGGDGIKVQGEDNVIAENEVEGNAGADCRDTTSGDGTAGTANT